MNSKYKGNVTELQCMLAFMKLGYNVLTPYGDCERYDFVVDVLKFKVKQHRQRTMVLLSSFVAVVATEKTER